MSLEITSISSVGFIPLSASYRYDDHIDLRPTLFNYDNGYEFFHHPVFEHTKDVKFAQDSFFSLTSANALHNLINDAVEVDPLKLVLFTSLLAGNGKYVSNIDNTLYASASSVGSSEYFRVIKNDDGSHSISQGDLYATVITTNNAFTLKMQDRILDDVTNVQKFYFYSGETASTFTIQTEFTISDWVGNNVPTQSSTIKRFLSYNDYYINNPVKAIGLVGTSKYVDENIYQFSVDVDINKYAIGFEGKIIWVKYYTEFLNKFFNRSVDVEDTATDLRQNYLVEYPYRSQIDVNDINAGNMKVNLITLKNVMTPEYNYHVRTLPLSA